MHYLHKIKFKNIPSVEEIEDMKQYLDLYKKEQEIKNKLEHRTEIFFIIIGLLFFILGAILFYDYATDSDKYNGIISSWKVLVGILSWLVYVILFFLSNSRKRLHILEKKYLPWKTNFEDYSTIEQKYNLSKFVSSMPKKLLYENHILYKGRLELKVSFTDKNGNIITKELGFSRFTHEQKLNIETPIFDLRNMKLTTPFLKY